MKPPTFVYHRPESVGEALRALADAGEHGKVLAGGQSLVPVLNMRLASPGHLVDINRLGRDLADVRTDRETVRLGALVRHAATLERGAHVVALPLLAQATAHVAHATIRNRGTTVGSIVHADPAGEMPAVLLLCDGEVELASVEGRRTVAAADFFVGPLESALRPGELATSAVFRIPAGHTGSAWVEVSRRAGDYALCGLGLIVTLDGDLRIARARAGYISVGPTPVLVDLTDAVIGQHHDAADWSAAGALAAAAMDPDADIHATAEYRRHLVRVLTARAARSAVKHALTRPATVEGEN
jgi:aerobic carbon-monoxide dehydrogenase medium subunit